MNFIVPELEMYEHRGAIVDGGRTNQKGAGK